MADLPVLSGDEIRRYSRHLILPEVGMDGQRRLKAAKVKADTKPESPVLPCENNLVSAEHVFMLAGSELKEFALLLREP